MNGSVIPGDSSPVSIPIESRTVELPTGILQVEVEDSDLSLDSLCDFAARQNPKRGFLFVSKRLGKHIPTKPSDMRDCYKRLADKISPDLVGPVVFIGMAETATALGHGVYEEYVKRTQRTDTVFVHTTRFELNREKALVFIEEHSHAVHHNLYYPADDHARALFKSARSLVLIDDEASTGKTFVNLAKAFRMKVASLLSDLVTVVITDWRGRLLTEQRHASLFDEHGIRTKSVSLLSGQYSFAPHPDLINLRVANSSGTGKFKDHILKNNYGRLGLVDPMNLHDFVKPLAIELAVGERCLVLGLGEFSYLPFLVAERLEHRYPEAYVAVQSTTRSPIKLGGAVLKSLAFIDHCQEGIANFLHNSSKEDFERVLICTETPADSIDQDLVRALNAQVLVF